MINLHSLLCFILLQALGHFHFWLFITTDYPDIKMIIKKNNKTSICEHLKMSSPFGNPLDCSPQGPNYVMWLDCLVFCILFGGGGGGGGGVMESN